MKTFSLFFLFLSLYFSAQTHRFIYDYQFKTDSTSEHYEETKMILDVNPSEVKFYDYEYAEKDSLNNAKGEAYISLDWDDTPAIIRKRNSNINLNFVYTTNLFCYETEDIINWILSKETKKQGDYLLQKATANFGGRNWTAWFNPLIPFNEGPYKFRGLPGLIFQIEDDKKQFLFNLVKIQNLVKTYVTKDFLENAGGQKALKVKESLILKKEIEYFNDPFHDMRQKFVYKENENITINKIRVTNKDQFKELSKSTQNYLRKNNNPIELNKAPHYPKD